MAGTCLMKSLNPKLIIYKEDQMRNENTYYFIEKSYDFKEDDEEVQAQLVEAKSKSQDLQMKLTNIRTMENQMLNFNSKNYTIPKLMIR
jgi:hypothetical protein